jgi:hypothetical protein
MYFGPLQDNMVVTKQCLPTLARQTAINAHHFVREKMEGYVKPWFARSHLLDELREKYREDGSNYAAFMQYVADADPKGKQAAKGATSGNTGPQTPVKEGSEK